MVPCMTASTAAASGGIGSSTRERTKTMRPDNDLKVNIDAFEAQRETLEKHYMGKHALFHEGEFAGSLRHVPQCGGGCRTSLRERHLLDSSGRCAERDAHPGFGGLQARSFGGRMLGRLAPSRRFNRTPDRKLTPTSRFPALTGQPIPPSRKRLPIACVAAWTTREWIGGKRSPDEIRPRRKLRIHWQEPAATEAERGAAQA